MNYVSEDFIEEISLKSVGEKIKKYSKKVITAYKKTAYAKKGRATKAMEKHTKEGDYKKFINARRAQEKHFTKAALQRTGTVIGAGGVIVGGGVIIKKKLDKRKQED